MGVAATRTKSPFEQIFIPLALVDVFIWNLSTTGLLILEKILTMLANGKAEHQSLIYYKLTLVPSFD